MNWNDVAGQSIAKNDLRRSIEDNRISHAQIFHGQLGSGSLGLAIAYANAVLNQENQTKIPILNHPDLHFSFPVAATKSVKAKPVSDNFLPEWKQFLDTNLYGNLKQWFQFLNIEKKQGNIGVHEAQEIIRFLSLSSFSNGYKVVIIWLPEAMNTAAANKLLKILEEPPKQTLFLLVCEQLEQLLSTIVSRCQVFKIPALQPKAIEEYLILHKNAKAQNVKRIAQLSQGDLNLALQKLNEENNVFEQFFIDWVRHAFQAKRKPSELQALVNWSEDLASWNREEQKQFLHYCAEVFRQALLQNYQTQDLVYFSFEDSSFRWLDFSNYIHGANIQNILEELSQAHYQIERNANGKILFLDLSIKLTRFLHQKIKTLA